MDKFLLILFFIIKIFVIIIAPVLLFRKREIHKYFIWTEIGALILIVVLYLFGFPYIVDSNITTISKLNLLSSGKKASSKTTNYNGKKPKYYSRVLSTKAYELNEGKKAYYYDINSEPLKDIEMSCDKKSYMEQYGESLSAITSLISNSFSLEMNEMELIDYLEDNNLIDCENGFDFNTLFTKLSGEYSFNIIQIAPSQIDYYISNGKNVLVETTNKYNEDNNFGCETSYLVIYNKNNDGNYGIINSNDHYESYFCPSNTIGYGSIIEGNQNDKAYSFDMINSKALRYFVIEVR